MQSRTIRRGILAVFAVFSVWLMPWVASAEVTVTPAQPTKDSNILIDVMSWVPSPCHDFTYSYSVVANSIRIDLTTVFTAPEGTLCA